MFKVCYIVQDLFDAGQCSQLSAVGSAAAASGLPATGPRPQLQVASERVTLAVATSLRLDGDRASGSDSESYSG